MVLCSVFLCNRYRMVCIIMGCVGKEFLFFFFFGRQIWQQDLGSVLWEHQCSRWRVGSTQFVCLIREDMCLFCFFCLFAAFPAILGARKQNCATGFFVLAMTIVSEIGWWHWGTGKTALLFWNWEVDLHTYMMPLYFTSPETSAIKLQYNGIHVRCCTVGVKAPICLLGG